MARKNIVIYQLASAASLGATYTSPVTLIKYLDNCAYQINASAGATGSFKVQASLDYTVSEVTNLVTNNGNWIDLTLAGGTPTLTGSADNIIINLNQLPFNAIRLVYTRVSGSGTASIYIMCRQVGG